ncbi:sulfite exporter TauE/SafE family protein [Pendulispora brunnea]|uniref:Sulfite exporter TauE/SafE family protein n=1 Tax=Pendulispora brunnea TaxID=2905690 RepID=A0ABZ2JYU3_9BACT
MTTMLLVSALSMGLLGGVHCIVMCGGIVGVLGAGLPRGTGPMKLTLAYNIGRIASYAMAGLAAGALGAAVARIDVIYGAQVGLRFLAGLFMLGVGLFLLGAWPAFSRVEGIGAFLWRKLEPFAHRLLPVQSARAAVLLGLLWGWIPCGLVYAALGLAVASGSPLGGALVMATFGAGTLPVLLTMGAFATVLARWARRPWLRCGAGIAIAMFGLVHLGSAAEQARWTSALTFGLVHPCCMVRR